MNDNKVLIKKVDGKLKLVNYTPYRKAYSQAKSVLVKKYNAEFKAILKGMLPQEAKKTK